MVQESTPMRGVCMRKSWCQVSDTVWEAFGQQAVYLDAHAGRFNRLSDQQSCCQGSRQHR